MTPTVPDREGGAGRVTQQTGPADAVTLVLSRAVKAGHEQAFEAVLRKLAAEVRRQPGHLGVTVLKPRPGGPPIYTVVSPSARRSDAGAWLSSAARARLVAEAGVHSQGALRAQYLSGLEGWLAAPGVPVLVPPARWKTALVSAAGILPLLELAGYVLALRLSALLLWARPLVFVVIVIAFMQYAVMPLLTRAVRLFLYPAPAGEPLEGES